MLKTALNDQDYSQNVHMFTEYSKNIHMIWELFQYRTYDYGIYSKNVRTVYFYSEAVRMFTE